MLVLTGDGEALMGLGALATAGAKRAANLVVAVLDNGHYAETGMQASHTAMGVDLAAVAAACGFAWSSTVHELDGMAGATARLEAGSGPGLLRLLVGTTEVPRTLPPRDGHRLARRLVEALGAPPVDA